VLPRHRVHDAGGERRRLAAQGHHGHRHRPPHRRLLHPARLRPAGPPAAAGGPGHRRQPPLRHRGGHEAGRWPA
ncbi:MAG: hypothetical protein AVDCRST_MAG41-838, partial [uncultured Corynebacteriales bacterium]